jgi:hypothetical protein
VAEAPTRLYQRVDLKKVITTDEEDRADLDQHGRCVVAQRRDVNPGLFGSKSTW